MALFLVTTAAECSTGVVAQVIITLFTAAYSATQGVTIVEIVPVHLRFSVVAFAYAVAVSVFGGITPLIATLLLKATHSHYHILVVYVSVCALISLFAV